MKITKRIFAVALAVLMIAALAIPFAANAETIPTTNNTLTINGVNGFGATVYKIADFNTTTGAFSNFAEKDVTDKSVENAIKAGYEGTEYTPDAALLTAAKALPDTVLTTIVAKAEKVFTATETSVTYTDLAAGVYYVKWTTVPSDRTKFQDSVLALPYYDKNTKAWVQTATINNKAARGTITDDKDFTGADAGKTYVSKNIGDTVPFVLTGTIPGSATAPATEFWFNAVMTQGLALNDTNIVVKALDAADAEHTLTSGTDFTIAAVAAGDKSFKVEFTQAQINALYTNNYKSIKIEYTAKLTETGVVIGGDGNVNTMTYHFKVDGTSYDDTKTKTVKTYEFFVKKTDANTGDRITNKTAKFTIYKAEACADSDKYTNDVITTGEVSTVNGIATFTGLEGGRTYYIKETAAPDGYGLNSKVFAVTVAANGTVSGTGVDAEGALTVPDPKIVLPNTGGEGTLMFTIAGLVLIAGAAVLFVVYRKKTAK